MNFGCAVNIIQLKHVNGAKCYRNNETHEVSSVSVRSTSSLFDRVSESGNHADSVNGA